jgi:hypothetical protein
VIVNSSEPTGRKHSVLSLLMGTSDDVKDFQLDKKLGNAGPTVVVGLGVSREISEPVRSREAPMVDVTVNTSVLSVLPESVDVMV